MRARRVEMSHLGVECPLLSPDNARIAFKKSVGVRSVDWSQSAVWQLETMTESMVTSETRSADDRVEWLDDDRVVYHLTGGASAADLWLVRVDSSAAPERSCRTTTDNAAPQRKIRATRRATSLE